MPVGSPEQKESQLTLAGFENIKRLAIERLDGQPKLGLKKELTGRDFLYTPLTRQFRAETDHWLETRRFPLDEVLKPWERKMLGFYLRRREGRWWSQGKVAAQMGWPERRAHDVNFRTKYALLRVWRRSIYGPWAVEILQLPWFLYRNFLVVQVPTIPDLTEIEDESKIRRICGSEFGLAAIQEALGRHRVEWNPAVTFPKFSYRA